MNPFAPPAWYGGPPAAVHTKPLAPNVQPLEQYALPLLSTMQGLDWGSAEASVLGLT